MIKTTKKKTKSVQVDLPPGWKWKPRGHGWQAINLSKNLKTSVFEGCAEAVAAATELEAASQDGLLGLAGKGLIVMEPVAEGRSGSAEEENGFHPGFPPGFDPKRAERGLAQEDEPIAVKMLRSMPAPVPKTQPRTKSAQKRATVETVSAADKKRLHEESIARWRRERPASADAGEPNGYHPQMLQMIPLDRIVPSFTNPRKHFDLVKLRELADSIQEHGLAQPILVRPTTLDPIPGGEYDESFDIQYYEIVAGERRWRAAKLAGLTVIEAKVRDLDDKAVLEIQFIENLQRADLSPIEEADGYKRLLDEHGYTADSLAGKLAKSKSYVYGRLKLCVLPPAALDALAKGDLPATVGELIGRLPSMEMRQKFWDQNYESYGNEWFEAPSFREIKETIERRYMRELKPAPWNKKDSKLLPEAGSCADCPKMTGNNRAEYPDGRADMCTDVPCFERKMQAHYERQVEKAEKGGAKVLSEKESAKLFNNAGDSSWLSHEATRKYVELKDQPFYDKEHRSYKQLLEGHVEPIIAIDPQGKLHHLAPKAEAEKVLKEVHGIKTETRGAMSDYKASEKKWADEKKLRQATAAEIVTRAIEDLEYNIIADADFLRVTAKFLICDGRSDVALAIVKRRGIEHDSAKVRQSLATTVDGMAAEDLPGLIVEWLFQSELDSWVGLGSGSGDKFPICSFFGLKPSVVLKEVSAKLKAEAKAKKHRGVRPAINHRAHGRGE